MTEKQCPRGSLKDYAEEHLFDVMYSGENVTVLSIPTRVMFEHFTDGFLDGHNFEGPVSLFAFTDDKLISQEPGETRDEFTGRMKQKYDSS